MTDIESQEFMNNFISGLLEQPATPDELEPTPPTPLDRTLDSVSMADIKRADILLLPQHNQALAFISLLNAAIATIDSMKIIAGKYGSKEISLSEVPGGQYLRDLINQDTINFNKIMLILNTANALNVAKNTIDIIDAVDTLNDNPLTPGDTPCETELKMAMQRLNALKSVTNKQ